MKFSYALIKRLVPRVPIKQKLVEALNSHSFEAEDLEGDAFEVGISPNRYSDAGSHIGIAREASAILNLPLKNPVKTIINLPTETGFIDVSVEDKRFAPRYAARCFDISKVGQSPKWMQDVLRSCGMKPINGIVDIMNFVMLETGQPLHAFDLDTIESLKVKSGKLKVESYGKKIIVRSAKQGEKIETLDGQNVVLDADMFVIADLKHALAIAGVKGGKDSGVTSATTKIIVEAANFDSTSVFKTSRKLKLVTDAASRFSHGISPELVEQGLDRATELITNFGAELVDSFDAYPRPAGDEVIELSVEDYERLIGTSIKPEKARNYFELLGFEVEPKNKKGAGFLVRIPAWRNDIENTEDLIEEAARLEGYGKIRPVPPLVSIQPAVEEDAIVFKDKVRNVLTALQLSEVYNGSFIGRADAEGVAASAFLKRTALADLVELENPISEEKTYLRPSLLPGLLKNVEDNSRFFDSIKIFEIGNVFRKEKERAREELFLGVAYAAKNNAQLIFELKGLVSHLLGGLGISDFSVADRDGAIIIESGRALLGYLRATDLKKGWTVATGEFNLGHFMKFSEEGNEFIPVNKFPAVIRDISILVPLSLRIGDIVEDVQESNETVIEAVDLIDEYVNEKLGGKQSITLRIIFQADDRTLTDEEVNKEMEKVSAVLVKKYKAEVR